MTRRFRTAALASLIVTAAVVSPAHSGRNEIASASVEIEVRWGGAAGSDTFRDELRRDLAEHLATTCFASVTIADAPPEDAESDLILAVVLQDAREETDFDDSIAGALQPGDPNQELRRVARCKVTIDLTLAARATGAVVVRKHLTATSARRPLYLGEDPQAGARVEVIDTASRHLSSALGCGGAKLGRKIRDALQGGATGTPRAR
jgi:hypothetical protein